MSDGSHRKTLGRSDIFLFTVSAILLLDTLAAAASLGVSAVSWWLILGVLFLVPFTLICAEMGCAYPEQGGIYAWVRDSFGRRWASRATWAYWINTAVWLPAIYIFFAGMAKQILNPALPMIWQIAIGISLTWITVAVNVIRMDVGKWVPNVGAIFKVFIFLVIIIAAFVYGFSNGMANQITWETLRPDLNSGIEFLPAIIYGMLGFELVSAGSEEIKDPAKDVPKAIFISAVVILLLYILGTIAILTALPSEDINLVEGLMDTLYLLLGGSGVGRVLATVLGVAALYTFFSNGATWAMGCNRAAAEAAAEDELPYFMGIESRKGTPLGAAVLMGILSTLVLVVYGFMSESNDDLFWALFSFSAVIFLASYFGMLFAFVKLRIVDADRFRPFQIPGGTYVAGFLAGICILILFICIVLFVYSPNDGMQWPVFVGVLTAFLLGEVAIRVGEKD